GLEGDQAQVGAAGDGVPEAGAHRAVAHVDLAGGQAGHHRRRVGDVLDRQLDALLGEVALVQRDVQAGGGQQGRDADLDGRRRGRGGRRGGRRRRGRRRRGLDGRGRGGLGRRRRGGGGGTAAGGQAQQ